MATVTMPQLGESVTEGTVLQWLKRPGDTVALDESICEIETEKVTAELPSPFEGTLGEILVPEGETVEVDAPLCTIDEVASEAPATEPAPVAALAADGAGPAPAPAPATDESRAGVYSPVVQRLAARHDIDLAAIAGSGRGGRVTRKDVQALIDEREREAAAADGIPPAAAPLPLPEGEVVPTPEVATVAPSGAYDVVPLSATRRKIGENMVRSTTEAPQAWMMVEADVTGLVDLRARERERFVGVDLTLPALLRLDRRPHPHRLPRAQRPLARRRAAALPARQSRHRHRHRARARRPPSCPTPATSASPVSRAASTTSSPAPTPASSASRDIEEGTFTVNNTGAFGAIASKPIVNHPQVGIVTMERVVRRPVVVEGDAIAIRSVMNVALSFDHRALDGAEAGGFLAALKERLEALG